MLKFKNEFITIICLYLFSSHCNLFAADNVFSDDLQSETERLEAQCTNTLLNINRTLEQCDEIANTTLTQLASQSKTLDSIERTCVDTKGKLIESEDLTADFKRGPFLNFFYRIFVPHRIKRWKRPIISHKANSQLKIESRRNRKISQIEECPPIIEKSQDHDDYLLSQIEDRLDSLKDKAALTAEEINYHTGKLEKIQETLEESSDKMEHLSRRIRR